MEIAVNVDNNRDSNGTFCCAHANREERHEEALKLFCEEQAVESRKVEVYSVEHELYRNEHGYQVAACDETIHTNEEQECAEHKITFYRYHNYLSSFSLRATTIAPTIQASRKTEMNSKGNTY